MTTARLGTTLAAAMLAWAGIGAAASPARVDRAATVSEQADRVERTTIDVRAAAKYEIRCGWPEERVAAASGPRVSSGTATIYIGTAQVSSNNQNPRLIRFDSGAQTWCRDDLEVTGDDHRGYGLAWDGATRLFAVFSATGTQGSTSQDFRRFATAGWLRTYSDASAGGGGPRVAIVARVDPATGTPVAATFLTARLSNGRVNSFTVTDLTLAGDGLVVDGSSFFSPRDLDRSPLSCEGGSPFAVRYLFDDDLGAPSTVDADRCR